ncbi:MAG: group I intron-associated PD-(D/E)XK endonuclease [Pelagibacteraceae bacterium]
MSQTTTGLIGEHFAAGIVLSLGWRVSMCQQDKVDLLAWKEDEFIRIQVKTAQLSGEKDARIPVYHFQFGAGRTGKTLGSKKDYDILCLIAYDVRKALFMPVTEVLQYSKRMSPKLFDAPKAELYSFNKALAAVRGWR